ncbi:hypothetical protein CABS01_17253 [Colletotrichum abscissum]|uniref:uncharacterized protein n=1 Tax=Colletotrichum abscissum TaxID=1671311 RepID=UPI0027D51F1C|nr:uncharacterized protein CABS01_17253 [Colletotrichum abscissum]KAK1481017.1 hypothetical protein CABS01_17253 [Colletotrichum abscissum]
MVTYQKSVDRLPVKTACVDLRHAVGQKHARRHARSTFPDTVARPLFVPGRALLSLEQEVHELTSLRVVQSGMRTATRCNGSQAKVASSVDAVVLDDEGWGGRPKRWGGWSHPKDALPPDGPARCGRQIGPHPGKAQISGTRPTPGRKLSAGPLPSPASFINFWPFGLHLPVQIRHPGHSTFSSLSLDLV